MKPYIIACLLAVLGILPGCGDELPTSTSGNLVPSTPRSVEVFLPFDQIGTDVQLFQGFGTQALLPVSYLADGYEELGLESRTLTRFFNFPRTITAPDLGGTNRTDSLYTVIGGRVIARLDSAGVSETEVDIRLGDITVPWDPGSASWDLALDTAGRQLAWPEPGGGPVEVLDTVTWLPQQADSVIFELDSATVAAWTDPENEARGVRMDLLEPGQRHRVTSVELEFQARPGSFEGVPVFVPLQGELTTFVYTPEPPPEADVFRFGGAPAWRTTFRFSLPEFLDGPPELCAALGCPLELDSDLVNYAALVLATHEIPAAYQTSDSVRLEVRPVLRPELLPKSPVGRAVTATTFGGFPPDYFGSGAPREVEVPLTAYIGQLVDEPEEGRETPSATVAVLSPQEPGSFMYGAFAGPGSALPPRLRLILTQAEAVDLP